MFIHTSSHYMAFALDYFYFYFFDLNRVIIYHYVTSMVSLITCSSYILVFHVIYSMLYVI